MKLLAALLIPTAALAQPAPNTLTPAETAAGWKLLFDGKTTANWRGYKQDKFPTQGWSVADGCIKSAAGEAPDIITNDQYTDFELVLEWKASPKGNSGIIYRCTEKEGASYLTGPEYQLLEDATYGAQPTDMHAAGAIYDICPPADGKTLKPVGEFNTARIVVQNGVVQHFVNDRKVVECRMDNDDWKSRIAKSKFKDAAGFGVQPKGHIAIQHHGNDMWFRNIKVRDLKAPMPGEKSLFNGNNFDGWTAILPGPGGNGKLEDVWSVQKDTIGNYPGPIIVCKGNPAGYIRTTDNYTNFVLQLDWRFNPAKGPGNSGVLFRMIGEDKVWPKSIEAQLHSGTAGDFWNIGDFTMTAAPERTNGRNTKRIQKPGADGGTLEHPIGEWNHYEIIVDGGTVTLKINNEVTNVATACEIVPGKICLQSEGAEIHFKDVRLAPIGK